MTRSKNCILHSSMGILLSALLACSANNEYAGIEGTGDSFTASGSITTFGSIWINGKRIHTDSAEILIEDSSAIESNLHHGMIVDVHGSVDQDGQYNAESIEYRTTITGEITSTSSLQNSIDRVLTINDQLVYVADDIEFEGTNFEDLAIGQTVSVSAFVKDEHLIATYIKSESNQTDSIITGFIDSIDEQNRQLTINQTSINYADVIMDESIASLSPSLWQGKKVRVSFTIEPTLENEVILASRISLADKRTPEAGSKFSIEGIINSVISSQLFHVDNFEVSLPESFIPDIDTNLIRDNQRVSIQGRINSNGMIEIENMEFIFSSPTRLEGRIDSIDLSERRLTLLGKTIYLNLLTVYQDEGPNQQRRFNFEDLNVSDLLSVYAYEYDGELYAKKVIRKQKETMTTRFRGRVEQINPDQSIGILGYTVLTDDLENPKVLPLIEVGKYIEVFGFTTVDNTINAKFIMLSKEPCSTPDRPHCHDLPFPDDKDHDHIFLGDDEEEFDKEFPDLWPWPDDKFDDFHIEKDEEIDSLEFKK